MDKCDIVKYLKVGDDSLLVKDLQRPKGKRDGKRIKDNIKD